MVVYRTEHEYRHIPLATPEKYSVETISMGKSSLGFGGYEDPRKSSGTISAAAHDGISREVKEKFVIDMNENDGYVKN